VGENEREILLKELAGVEEDLLVELGEDEHGSAEAPVVALRLTRALVSVVRAM